MRNDENEEVSFRLCVSGATDAVCCVLMVFFSCVTFRCCLSTFNRLEVNASFNYKVNASVNAPGTWAKRHGLIVDAFVHE